MANRDALRELQTRLAARLEASKTASTTASWLAVEGGGQHFLIPLRQAGEIFSLPPVQPVAYTEPWFHGVANLRGGLYGVVDFGRYAGGAAAPVSNTGAAPDARLITVNGLLDFNCALRVERLWGLRGPEAFTDQAPPDADAPAWHGHRYTDTAGLPWQEINLQTLCAQPDFVQIGIAVPA